jgi:hypothetical protein
MAMEPRSPLAAAPGLLRRAREVQVGGDCTLIAERRCGAIGGAQGHEALPRWCSRNVVGAGGAAER